MLDRRISIPSFETNSDTCELFSPSGIGLESSLLFASEGCNIVSVDINLPGAEKAVALITERYPNVKALAIKVDVAKEEEVKNAVDKAVKEFGRLDVMVSVFGIVSFDDAQLIFAIYLVQQRR